MEGCSQRDGRKEKEPGEMEVKNERREDQKKRVIEA